MKFPINEVLVLNPSLFYKQAVAKRRLARHDLAFRRKNYLAELAREANKSIKARLLDKKVEKFFDSLRGSSLSKNAPDFFPKRYIDSPPVPLRVKSAKVVNRRFFFKKSFNLFPDFSQRRSDRVWSLFTKFSRNLFFRRSSKRAFKKKIISTFDKAWQKHFTRLIQKSFFPFGNKFLKRLKQDFSFLRPTGLTSKTFGNQTQFPLVGRPYLVFFLKLLFPGSPISFSFELVKQGFISINSKPVTNPFSLLSPDQICAINIHPILFLTMRFIFFRLSSKQLFLKFFQPKFKRFAPGSFFELNFKSSEFLLLPNNLSEIPFSFIDSKINSNITLAQRFFPKQKRFGLGRLIR